jgi:DNA-binding response OmpR family regulator
MVCRVAGSALILDEDRKFATMLGCALAVHGFSVAQTCEGRHAIVLAERSRFDAVVVDGVARRYDPIAVCDRLRELEAGTIVLRGIETLDMARHRALVRRCDARVKLDTGALDIALQVRAEVTRRALAASAGWIRRGDLAVDLSHREAFRGERRVPLTGFEFDLLVVLAREDGVVRKEALSDALTEVGRTLGPSIDVHVCNLRKKLRGGPNGPNLIRTIRAEGYRLTPAEPATQRR